MKKTHILTLLLMLTVSVAFGQTPYKLNYPDITIGNSPTGKIVLNGSNLRLPRIVDGSPTDSVLTIVSGVIKKVPRSQFSGGGGGSVSWGAITGILSDQADLQTALNAKLNSSTAASTYYPLSTNPAGYITSASVPVYSAGYGMSLVGQQFRIDTNIVANLTKSNYFDNDAIQKIGDNISYGKFTVAGNYNSLNRHSFDDYSVLTPTVGGLGYGVFDASTKLGGSVNNDHIIAYQARQTLEGSGNIGTADNQFQFNSLFGGFFWRPTHNGSGTIYTSAGGILYDVAGSGSIRTNYGLVVQDLVRGSVSNTAIKTGKGKVLLGDQTVVNADVDGLTAMNIINPNPNGYGLYIQAGNSSNYSLRILNGVGQNVADFKGDGSLDVVGNVTAPNFRGLADNSTKWNGLDFGGLYSAGSVGYGLLYNNTTSKAEFGTSDNFKSFLNLPLTGETLATATGRGNLTPNILQVTSSNSPSTLSKGLTMFYSSTDDYSVIQSYDYPGSTRKRLKIQPSGGQIDIGLSTQPNDTLRVNTNTKISVLAGVDDRPVFAASDGTLKIGTSSSYTLPIASSTVLGGVKVGSGLSIDGTGILSATGGGGSFVDLTTNQTVAGNKTWTGFSTFANYSTNAFTLKSNSGISAPSGGDVNVVASSGKFLLGSSTGTMGFIIPTTGTLRDFTFPNKSGTVAMLDDITGGSQTLQQVLTAGATATIEPVIQRNGSNLTLGLSGGGGANGFTIRGTGRDWYHFVQTNGNYTFGANQGDKYFFTNDGKLGINQSTPAVALDVVGVARVSTAPTASTDVVRLTDLNLRPISIKTSNYTVTSSDFTLVANTASSAINFTLPTASSSTGKMYNFKRKDAGTTNAMTVTAAGSDLIDGTATKTTTAAYGGFTIQSDGLSWIVIP